MKAELIHCTSPDNATTAMSKCYGKKCTEKSLANAVHSGHLSLLEHVHATFDMEMSQKCLAQITRHRHLSFTVESTRGSNFSKADWFDSVYQPKLTADEAMLMNTIIRQQIEQYNNLIDAGIPYQVAAYVLPLATNVRLTVSGNLRAWLEYLPKRLCKRASTEHQIIATQVYLQLNQVYPGIVNLQTMGMCQNCKESSCDFTVHGKQQKEPVVKDLMELAKNMEKAHEKETD